MARWQCSTDHHSPKWNCMRFHQAPLTVQLHCPLPRCAPQMVLDGKFVHKASALSRRRGARSGGAVGSDVRWDGTVFQAREIGYPLTFSNLV